MKISVSVKPNSRASSIEKMDDGTFIVHLKSAPIDGKANGELICILSRYFRVPQNAIEIKRGGAGKKKFVEIQTD